MPTRELEKPRSETLDAHAPTQLWSPTLVGNSEGPLVVVASGDVFRPAGTGPACSSCLERREADPPWTAPLLLLLFSLCRRSSMTRAAPPACWPVCSLPSTPEWPGIQRSCIADPCRLMHLDSMIPSIARCWPGPSVLL